MAMSSFCHIVNNIISIFGSLQSNYFSHVNRYGNAIAHASASRSDENYTYRHPKAFLYQK